MQQSSVIFANLLIAYLLFITMKGELPTYIDLLRGGGKESSAGGQGGGVGGSNSVTQGAEALLNQGSSDNSVIDSAPNFSDFGSSLSDFGGDSAFADLGF